MYFLEKCHVHNIFTINPKYYVIIGCYEWEKNNLIYKFTLELIATYHLWFVVKMLWT